MNTLRDMPRQLIYVLVFLPILQLAIAEYGCAEPLDNWHKRDATTTMALNNVRYLGGMFVAPTQEDPSFQKENLILFSNDGITWRASKTSNYYGSFKDVAYGNNTFVVVLDGGTAYTSADGSAWTKRSTGSACSLNSIVYGAGKFVTVGYDAGGMGVVRTSPDGISWTPQILNTSNLLSGITYGNGLFVAVGRSGKIITSPDGAIWTERLSNTTIDLHAVTYGKGLYLAVGDDTTWLTSPNGIDWTARKHPTAGYHLYGVTYGNGYFAVVGENELIATSTDGINWKERWYIDDSVPQPWLYWLKGIAFGNNTFVTIGHDGLILQSDPIVSTEPVGSLTVTLTPPAAVSAGAQWNVDGGAWQNSGAMAGGLDVGPHTVNYKMIPGWTDPPSETVTITNGQTTALTRNYSPLTKDVSLPFLMLLLDK